MNKKEIIKRLLILSKKINEIIEENPAINEDYFGHRIDEIEDLILDIAGIPEDTTMTENWEDSKYFCRDYWTDLIFDYLEENKELEDVINKILNWDEKKEILKNYE